MEGDEASEDEIKRWRMLSRDGIRIMVTDFDIFAHTVLAGARRVAEADPHWGHDREIPAQSSAFLTYADNGLFNTAQVHTISKHLVNSIV